ncbi:MAG: class I SAM-dependent methyltransferase [Chitinophagaceae bacterium]
MSFTPVHYTSCPACRSTQIQPVTEVKDHSISGTVFSVWTCAQCTLRFTQDVPPADAIGPFYAATHYVSHSDTEEGLVNKVYQLVKKRTIKGKVNKINQWCEGKKGTLLDIGCGTGSFLAAMKTDGWKVDGLEPDPGARTLAAEKTGQDILAPEKLYELPASSYDVITLWHVLEHVHDLQGYAASFQRLLKPGGKLLIAVPNYTSADAQHYGGFWAAWDVPRHLYHFSPRSVNMLMEGYGFSAKGIKPMWFDSFYVSMLSEQYKKGNIIKAFFMGLWSNLNAVFSAEKCSSLIYLFRK